MEPVSKSFIIDLRRLQVLRELRQRGTVAATAAALRLTPSAVSQQLAGLAKEAGVPLVEKQGRGVRLTGQAHVLLEHADVLHAQLERARADLDAWRAGQVGTVRIGSLSTAVVGLVAPAIERLSRSRPRLRLQVFEIEGRNCFTQLDAGELDLAIAVEDNLAPVGADPRYHRQSLLNDPLDVALPRRHPLAVQDSVRLADLADLPWVTGNPDSTCYNVTLASCAQAGFRPDVRHYCNEWDAVCALVAAGVGIALVPRLAAIRNSRIALRPVRPIPTRHLRIAVRAGSERSPMLSPVIEALHQVAADAA